MKKTNNRWWIIVIAIVILFIIAYYPSDEKTLKENELWSNCYMDIETGETMVCVKAISYGQKRATGAFMFKEPPFTYGESVTALIEDITIPSIYPDTIDQAYLKNYYGGDSFATYDLKNDIVTNCGPSGGSCTNYYLSVSFIASQDIGDYQLQFYVSKYQYPQILENVWWDYEVISGESPGCTNPDANEGQYMCTSSYVNECEYAGSDNYVWFEGTKCEHGCRLSSVSFTSSLCQCGKDGHRLYDYGNVPHDDSCFGEKVVNYYCDPTETYGYDFEYITCDAGRTCVNGECTDTQTGCTSDNDCSGELVCEVSSGECMTVCGVLEMGGVYSNCLPDQEGYCAEGYNNRVYQCNEGYTYKAEYYDGYEYVSAYFCWIKGTGLGELSFQVCPDYHVCSDGLCEVQRCHPDAEICTESFPYTGYKITGDVYKCRYDGSDWDLKELCSVDENCEEQSTDRYWCVSKTRWYCGLECSISYSDVAPNSDCKLTVDECKAQAVYCYNPDTNSCVKELSTCPSDSTKYVEHADCLNQISQCGVWTCNAEDICLYEPYTDNTHCILDGVDATCKGGQCIIPSSCDDIFTMTTYGPCTPTGLYSCSEDFGSVFYCRDFNGLGCYVVYDTCEQDEQCSNVINVKCVSVDPCGNGALNDGEDCDGIYLNSKTCTDFGKSGAGLKCNSDCTFDTSDCTVVDKESCETLCGNWGEWSVCEVEDTHMYRTRTCPSEAIDQGCEIKEQDTCPGFCVDDKDCMGIIQSCDKITGRCKWSPVLLMIGALFAVTFMSKAMGKKK